MCMCVCDVCVCVSVCVGGGIGVELQTWYLIVVSRIHYNLEHSPWVCIFLHNSGTFSVEELVY